MPSFHVSVPHALGQALARQRVENFLDQVRRDLPAFVNEVDGAWNQEQLDFRLTASGMKISGTLVVAETIADVSGTLPLAAVLFRGQIERTIKEELAKLLS